MKLNRVERNVSISGVNRPYLRGGGPSFRETTLGVDKNYREGFHFFGGSCPPPSQLRHWLVYQTLVHGRVRFFLTECCVENEVLTTDWSIA